MGSPPAISIAESLGVRPRNPAAVGQVFTKDVLVHCPSTPQRTPVSLLQSLTPIPSPFTVNGRAGGGLVEHCRCSLGQRAVGVTNKKGSTDGLIGGCGIFSFTLRKADGAELGLNVSHSSDVTRLAASMSIDVSVWRVFVKVVQLKPGIASVAEAELR
eukprot:Skav216146  [mRNA]  locus=scaffold2590:62750:65565:- [translate_table: standard]